MSQLPSIISEPELVDSDTQDGKDADLQILFVSEQHHWILSSFHENDVSIYDSPHFPLPHLWSSNYSRFMGQQCHMEAMASSYSQCQSSNSMGNVTVACL